MRPSLSALVESATELAATVNSQDLRQGLSAVAALPEEPGSGTRPQGWSWAPLGMTRLSAHKRHAWG
ncbi:MAG: helix-turn-helix domain-containing protein [Umezawaea sp.]